MPVLLGRGRSAVQGIVRDASEDGLLIHLLEPLLEPDIPAGRIAISPGLPSSLRSLAIRGIRFPTGTLSIDLDHDRPRPVSVPGGVVVELRPTGSG